jgi:hypothetical protein
MKVNFITYRCRMEKVSRPCLLFCATLILSERVTHVCELQDISSHLFATIVIKI